MQELRDALVRFKRTGKPSWAYLESPGNLEYLLATGCAKVALAPTALLDVSGLAAEISFYRGTLDKLGIEAQFEGVGKYKNAPNQLTERGFTEPHREQMNALVDGALRAVRRRRSRRAAGSSRRPCAGSIDRGPFLASEAKAAGLVDELLYRDEVEGRVPGGRLAAAPYVRAARAGAFDRRPKLALVYAVGDLMPGDSQEGPFGNVAGSDTIIQGLRAAREDASVRAVVLRVDSPGGSGTASDAIWREVQLTRREKPVVASMGDYAASGGFYVAMGADAIVAQPGTITGSIGVFSGKFSLRGLYAKLGISQETVQRGRNATLFSSYEPWDDARAREGARAQPGVLRDLREQGGRGAPQDAEPRSRSSRRGASGPGREAALSGLVDGLGGLDEAVRLARQRARIPAGQSVQLVVLPETQGLLRDAAGAPGAGRLRAGARPAGRVARALHAGARRRRSRRPPAVRPAGPLTASRRSAAGGVRPPAA